MVTDRYRYTRIRKRTVINNRSVPTKMQIRVLERRLSELVLKRILGLQVSRHNNIAEIRKNVSAKCEVTSITGLQRVRTL